MALHPAIERLIVLVAEEQVARALREQRESSPGGVSAGAEVHELMKNPQRATWKESGRERAP